MVKTVLITISLIVLTISVISIFDAREIAKNQFSSSQINETTKILKIVGLITSIIGLLILYFAL